ncbi:hypothetical protein Tco_0341151, partial [Tanacetum coccineum]
GSSEKDDDDDENNFEDESDDGDNDDDGDNNEDDGDDNKDDGDNDANGDDNQEDDDKNDDEEETDSDRTKSDRIKIPVLNQSSTENYKEEEEHDSERVHTPPEFVSTNDEEKMDEEEDDKVTKELYKDVKVNLGNKDAKMTSLLNLENPSPTDNEIASLMHTTVHHEEPRSHISSLYTVPVTAIPKITSVFTITIPPPPPFFNPLQQQATPTLTPTTSEATTLFLALLDFLYVFKFNDKVTNLEKDLSKMKQVDQEEAQVEKQAIQLHNAEFREEAQAEKQEYIDLVDTSRNVTESLEAAVLAKSSSQPKSTYEAAASFSEYELTKILIDKMEESKSHLIADYKRELYDRPVKSYNTDKDLFETYREVFTLKRSRDEKDKDQDPSAGSDRGTKRRKSSKEAESQKDPRSKEGKSSSSSKGTSRSHHKSSGKSAHAEEPSHTVDDSRVQKNQEFDMGNNDEQPDDKAAPKNDWFKKLERPSTPDPDWNKR